MSVKMMEVHSLRSASSSIMGRIRSAVGSGTFGIGTSHFQFQYEIVVRVVQE